MKSKRARVLVNFLTTFALILTMVGISGRLTPTQLANAVEDSPLQITTKAHFNDPDTPEIWEYPTGQSVELMAIINPSDIFKDLRETVLTLEVAKDYVHLEPTFVGSDLADSSEKAHNDKYWRYIYKFSNFSNVNVTGFPFKFAQTGDTTPNEAKTVINWSMTTPDGKNITSTSANLIALAGRNIYPNPGWENINIYQAEYPRYFNDARIYDIQVEDPATTTTFDQLTSDGTPVAVNIPFRVSFTSPYPDGYGLIRPSTVTLKATLPKDAKLPDESVYSGWKVVNEAEGKVELKTTPYDYQGYDSSLVFSFNNIPLKDSQGNPVIHTVTMQAIFDEGLASEEVFDKVEHKFGFNPIEAKTEERAARASIRGSEYHRTLHLDGEFFPIEYYSYYPARNPSVQNVINLEANPKSITRLGHTTYVNVLRPTEIELFEIDPRIYVEKIGFPSLGTRNPEVAALEPKLIGKTADGTETELASLTEAFGPENWPTFTEDVQKYTSLLVRFAPGTTAPKNMPLVTFQAMPTKAEKARLKTEEVKPGEVVKYKMKTQAQLIDVEKPQTPIKLRASDFYMNLVQSPISYLAFDVSPSKTIAAFEKCDKPRPAGEKPTTSDCSRIIHYRVTTRDAGLQYREGIPANLKIVGFLPEGIEYVRNTEVVDDLSFPRKPHPEAKVEVVENFNNTGKTAIVATIPQVETERNKNFSYSFDFDLDVTIYASDEKTPLNFYLISDAPAYAKEHSNTKVVPDEMDIDLDGDSDEKVLLASVNVQAKLPLELQGHQHVSADKRSWSFLTPLIEPGKPVYTRVEVKNSSSDPVRNLTIFSVLGQPNDHKLAAEADGSFAPRMWERTEADGKKTPVEHSAFIAPLTGPIESLRSVNGPNGETNPASRLDVFYSEKAITADNSALLEDEGWLSATEVKDWNKILAVKLVMHEKEAIEAGETISFIMPQRMPDTDEAANLMHADRSIGSVGISTIGTTISEGNETAIQIPRYSVSGAIFEDLNEDGLLSENEKPLANVPVSLLNAETGEIAKDLKAKPVSLTTDAEGKYRLTNLLPGTYRLQVKKNQKQIFTLFAAATAATAPAVVENSAITTCRGAQTGKDFGSTANCAANAKGIFDYGVTEAFTISALSSQAVRNVGIQPLTRAVKLAVINEKKEPLKDIKFSLTWVKELPTIPAPETIPDVFEGVTDETGKVQWDSLPYGRYELVELDPQDPYVPLKKIFIDVTRLGLVTSDQPVPVDEITLTKVIEHKTVPPKLTPVPPTAPTPVPPKPEPTPEPVVSEVPAAPPVEKIVVVERPKATPKMLPKTGVEHTAGVLSVTLLLMGFALIGIRKRILA